MAQSSNTRSKFFPDVISMDLIKFDYGVNYRESHTVHTLFKQSQQPSQLEKCLCVILRSFLYHSAEAFLALKQITVQILHSTLKILMIPTYPVPLHFCSTFCFSQDNGVIKSKTDKKNAKSSILRCFPLIWRKFALFSICPLQDLIGLQFKKHYKHHFPLVKLQVQSSCYFQLSKENSNWDSSSKASWMNEYQASKPVKASTLIHILTAV